MLAFYTIFYKLFKRFFVYKHQKAFCLSYFELAKKMLGKFCYHTFINKTVIKEKNRKKN